VEQMQGPGVAQRGRHQRRVFEVGEHDRPEGRVDRLLGVKGVGRSRVRDPAEECLNHRGSTSMISWVTRPCNSWVGLPDCFRVQRID
jgi:hypothetical protein